MASLEAHYETVRARHGYDGIDFALGDRSASTLRRRFVAADDAEAVGDALDDETLVTTGVGMTGPPHPGTLGQILTAIELQTLGVDVQFVLADLEPYHGGADWERVRALAERYREFVLACGFDADAGRLRTQSEATDVMRTGHRLARYYDPDEWDDPPSLDPTDWERAVEALYESDGGDADSPPVDTAGPTSAAADAHSAVLHGADFLHPLAGDYERVLLVFGIDEHHLTPWTRRFLDATPLDGSVAGLYTRMVPGLDGAPKMSKSVPGAGLSLAADPDVVRERIVGADGDYDRPAESAVFRAACLASQYDAAHLDDIERACERGGEAWAEAKREYAADVAAYAREWRATA